MKENVFYYSFPLKLFTPYNLRSFIRLNSKKGIYHIYQPIKLERNQFFC